jgi:Domain of unknown function (DUF5122) beta-propeller
MQIGPNHVEPLCPNEETKKDLWHGTGISNLKLFSRSRESPMRFIVPALHVVTLTSIARALSKARKAALLLPYIAVLLAGGVTAARGQSALDGFDPNASGGKSHPDVSAIAVQSDGKIVVGGAFTKIGGQERNHIARLDATTGLADSFDPHPDVLGVYAIAVQTDGKILAGGCFGSISGQNQSYFARLSNDTAALQNVAVTQPTATWTKESTTAR